MDFDYEDYDAMDGPPGMQDFMGQDPFEDYSYDDLKNLYEQYADENQELANMILYGMQMKMAKAGTHSNIGNKYYKELDIDEFGETEKCVSDTFQQNVKSVGSLIL